jgi:AcrR family transcriptional regulator
MLYSPTQVEYLRELRFRMSLASRKKARAPRSAERTKAQFLDAAEEVFGGHGYEGTTIRAIAKKAGVNLGTLQHYWGSKLLLFRDLFEIRFEPLKQETLRRLRAIERHAPDGSRPDAEELLRALIETTFLIGLERQSDSSVAKPTDLKQFHRLYGRALMDPSQVVIAELTRIFKEPVELFLTLMQRACPQLRAAELDWRMNCIIGAQGFSMVYSERVGVFFGPVADVDAKRAADWMIHFLANGINAPAFAEQRKPRFSAAWARSDSRSLSAVDRRAARAGSTPRR